MYYAEYPVTSRLRPFVKLVWSMEDDGNNSNIQPIRILPDTCVELVIHFSDPYKTRFSNNTSSVQPRSFIVSQMKSFMEIEPTGKTGFIAARFTATGAYRFFSKSLKSISNMEIALNYVWKAFAPELENKISKAKDMNERSRILQSFLYAILCKTQVEAAPVVECCLKEIQLAKGLISVEDLSYKTGVSNRQLLRQFDHFVGLSPKEFARITKFLHSLNTLAKRPADSLTSIAYQSGYYDQAHFIRDFKEYSGLTPGEYLQSGNVVY
jgi:AraC-like DNA-binding protein